jgi:hypothetical protein
MHGVREIVGLPQPVGTTWANATLRRSDRYRTCKRLLDVVGRLVPTSPPSSNRVGLSSSSVIVWVCGLVVGVLGAALAFAGRQPT